MMPQRFISRRVPSGEATCLRYMGDFHGTPLICGAEMELTLYRNAISENCTAGSRGARGAKALASGTEPTTRV